MSEFSGGIIYNTHLWHNLLSTADGFKVQKIDHNFSDS